jgi:hypothetical protein
MPSRCQVVAVHWSPPFEGPLKVPFDDVMPYYDAYRVFHEIVESGRHQVQFKLAQGDTVIFNQRRYGLFSTSLCMRSVEPTMGAQGSPRPQRIHCRLGRCAPPAGHLHQHR